MLQPIHLLRAAAIENFVKQSNFMVFENIRAVSDFHRVVKFSRSVLKVSKFFNKINKLYEIVGELIISNIRSSSKYKKSIISLKAGSYTLFQVM